MPPVDNLPTIWYPYANFSLFPELGSGGGTAMGGPVYHYDADLQSDTKWPAYWDGSEIFYEWSRSYLKDVRFTESGELLQINPMFAGIGFSQPMDMEFGPDGSLYVIEYGGGFFTVGPNVGLYQIDYVKGRHRPDIVLDSDADSGPAPLTVSFDASGSSDQDGDALTFAWDFDGDGTTDATGSDGGAHVHGQRRVRRQGDRDRLDEPLVDADAHDHRRQHAPAGERRGARRGRLLRVDGHGPLPDRGHRPRGRHDRLQRGEPRDRPRPRRAQPPDRSEDRLRGRRRHRRDPGGPLAELAALLRAPRDLHATTAPRAAGVLEGSQEITLRPKFWEAELYDLSQGVQQTVTSARERRPARRLGQPRRLVGVRERQPAATSTRSRPRVSSGSNNNGRIEFRLDAPDGPKIGEVTVPNTGGWDIYRTLDPAPMTDPGGTHTLYLVAADDQAGDLLDLDWLRFNGMGVATKLAAHPTADRRHRRRAAADDPRRRACRTRRPATTFAWDFGDGQHRPGRRGRRTATPRRAPTGATFTATLDGDDDRPTAASTCARSSASTGTLAVTRESATPFVGDPTTVSATFDPSGDQSAAGRDVTFQVYRESRLSGLPAGHSSGTPYPRVERRCVQTDADGVARFTYTGEVLASDIVVACLATALLPARRPETTLVIDDAGAPVNLRDGRRSPTAAGSTGSSSPRPASGRRCGTGRRSPAGITPAPAASSA